MTFELLLRIVLIASTVIAMTLLGANWVARRRSISRRTRRVSGWIYALLGVLAYSSGEAEARGLPLNNAIYGFIFCLVGLIVSLLWHPKGDSYVPPNDNSWSQKLLDLINSERKRRRLLHELHNKEK